MIQAKHCDLCKFPERDLKNGLTCGLTKKKPIFKNKCYDLEFSESFKDYLPELLDQISDLKKRKSSIYFNLILFSILGVSIIIGSYPYLKRTLEIEFDYVSRIYYWNVVLIYLAGSILISMGLSRFLKYRRLFKTLESEKQELNNILHKYNVDIHRLTRDKLN